MAIANTSIGGRVSDPHIYAFQHQEKKMPRSIKLAYDTAKYTILLGLLTQIHHKVLKNKRNFCLDERKKKYNFTSCSFFLLPISL